MPKFVIYQLTHNGTHLFNCVPVLGFKRSPPSPISSACIVPFKDLGFYELLKSPAIEQGNGFCCNALTPMILTEPIANLYRPVVNIILWCLGQYH